jgi:hypothetical protein
MRTLRSAPLIFLLLAGLPAAGDTEFQGSIPVETVEALFNTYHDDQFAVYSDIAEEFPDFPVPDGFTVVGSVYQMTQLSVVFETESVEEEAAQTIITVFENQDWIQFPVFARQNQEVGFIAPQPFNPGRSQTLCHDDLGHISIRGSTTGNGNYLSLGFNLVRSNQQGNCEQQLAMQQVSAGQMSRSIGLRQYLPRMEIPEQQNRLRTSPFFVSGGFSSSGNTVDTDGAMTSEQDIDEIYEYFSDQIEEQGWELDSEVVGSLSANGTWTKSPEANLRLIGRLAILDSGESNYDLHFVLTAEGYTGNSSAIFSPIGQ